VKDLILMIQFMTRIPLKLQVETDEESFARGVVYFPIIGLLIGGFNLILYLVVLAVFPKGGTLLAAIFAVLGNLLITGGLHFDGLGDTCDGIFSGRTRERMLEIMKDSHIGTFGTLGIIMDIALRIGIIAGLSGKFAILGILLSPMVSKTAVVQLMTVSKYARANGMGGLFLGRLRPIRIMLSFLLGIFLFNAAFPIIMGNVGLMVQAMLCLSLIVVLFLVLFGFRSWTYGCIGGMTGDTIGAANEVFEWVFLLFVLFLSGGIL